MEFGFETIRHRRGQCTLFCKMDCSIEEEDFLCTNGLLRDVVYEQHVKPGVLKRTLSSIAYVATASSHDSTRGKQKAQLMPPATHLVTIQHLLAGAGIQLSEFEAVEAQKIIEARIIVLGETMNAALGNRDGKGRWGVV